MPLSKIRNVGKKSSATVLQARLKNPKFQLLYGADLNAFHYKRLTRPTLQMHATLKQHYANYAAQLKSEGKQAESSEIVIGTTLPPLGTFTYVV